HVLVHLLPRDSRLAAEPAGSETGADTDALESDTAEAWVVSLPDDRFRQHPCEPGQALSLHWSPADAHALAAA
ncbi:TOBE domain-containing protein, partial [Ideonella sp.]|uniref:TOBE domain-containing protein n=1 Tax=Ideonella sp. TaxID=1929293 RepID=UPI003BB4E8C7